MQKSFDKLLTGYQAFRKKYAAGDESTMKKLACDGQHPDTMIVACSDSRVDPSIIFQADPGDIFMVRNVANIIPPFENDESHHGTSAALEFGICHLKVKHLIILGHSQCGGIQALIENSDKTKNDFIDNWVSIIKKNKCDSSDPLTVTKLALTQSHQNAMTFPWIKSRIDNHLLEIHLMYFDIEHGQLFAVDADTLETKIL